MEVVEMVEVVEADGEHHQEGQVENFEDLILTVVPEGSEGDTITATTTGTVGGHRTILVHNQVDHEKDKKIESLTGRVEELENQVHFLEDELRLLRRKVVGNANNVTSTISSTVRKTVLEILNKQTLKISLSGFEDEMAEPMEPGRGARPSTSGYRTLPKKRRYEDEEEEEEQNGFSEEEQDEGDVDYSGEEKVARKRGRPRGGGGARVGRKPKVNRVELSPPPQKSVRPRGRARHRAGDNEDAASMTPLVQRLPIGKKSGEGGLDESVTGGTENEEEEDTAADQDGDEELELEAAEASGAKTKTQTALKKGNRAAAESSPVRTSSRMRKTSKKAND